jgi:glutathione S-transferase
LLISKVPVPRRVLGKAPLAPRQGRAATGRVNSPLRRLWPNARHDARRFHSAVAAQHGPTRLVDGFSGRVSSKITREPSGTSRGHDIAAFKEYGRETILPHGELAAAMFTLYSMQRSGNSYKARLALAQLGIPYRLIEIDILKGESHTPEFLTKNPNGQVPLLEVAPGRYLSESNAILWYIAGGTPLAPEDRIERAEALQWMFFEQHSLEPNLGAAYFWLTLVKGGRDLQRHAFEDWMEEGYRALGVMEKHIALHDFFAADRYTIADIALYAYTHIAHLCDYDLAGFPALRAWLARVAAEPGHVTMESKAPTAAIAQSRSVAR